MWGVVPSFSFVVLVAASQKPDFGISEMENILFVGQKKIGLRVFPRHPMGHARVQYGTVPTIYAMIRADPSLFDLKAMQPRTWYVISVKELSGKLLFLRFDFFPTSR
jgi:hypothetical protein